MTRFALGIEYDGRAFSGWQRQSHAASVQQTLESCLSEIADEPISVHCAGRTDSGVHALGQVVHFESANARPQRAWTLGVNSLLPREVAVTWVAPVPDDFHARFSAQSRTYQYIILNQPLRSALWSGRVTWELRPLVAERMHQASQYWLGEHDFSAFRAAGCQAKTPFRCIESIAVRRQNEYIVVRVCANAFLHHMVRNLVGVLVEIGTGRREPLWAQEVLFGKNRQKAAKTAPPDGLYLVEVGYPAHYGLPRPERNFPGLID